MKAVEGQTFDSSQPVPAQISAKHSQQNVKQRWNIQRGSLDLSHV